MAAIFEYMLGIIVGYLILSPRFRAFLKKSIMSWRPHQAETPKPLPPLTRAERKVKATPQLNGKGQLMVDDETLQEYLKNPDVTVKG